VESRATHADRRRADIFGRRWHEQTFICGVQLAAPVRIEHDLAQVLSELGVGNGLSPAALAEATILMK
jgi:hypothetical protein